MKKTLPFLFLFFTGVLSAQIISISDPYLKTKLLSATSSNNIAKNNLGVSVKIDTNNDGEIQVSEAAVIWQLSLSAPSLMSVTHFDDLQNFENLRKLSITRFSFQTSTIFDASSFTFLTDLTFSESNLTALNISGLNNLQTLSCTLNDINSLNVSGLSALVSINCTQNQLNTIIFSGNSNLKYLSCSFNNLSSLDLSGFPVLERLDVQNNNISQLNFSQVPLLKQLNFNFNNISGPINLSNLSQLQNIQFVYNNISEVILGTHQNLDSFTCSNNNISELNLSGMPSLFSLACNANNLSQLDFSANPFINDVFAANNPITYVNLKNGGHMMLDAWDLVALTPNQESFIYICVDDEYEQNILYANFQGHNPQILNNILFSTNCSFTPGGDFNTISGTLIFDQDNNGCSPSDAVMHYGKVLLNDVTQTGLSIINSTGNYDFFVQAGIFNLSPQLENPWFVISPPTATVNFADNNNNTATQNFCIAPTGVHPDVEVALVPVNNAQPGFNSRYQVVYKNKGNQALSGNVVLNYDEAILDYISSGSTVPTSTASGQLTWAYSNLLPFESRTLNIVLNLNGPMETPAVNLDDVLNYSVSISPTTGDETPADNTFILNQIVTGSYDPNDITCLEGDTVHPDKIGEYLHYNINFENTGTAPATFIVVKDMINAQQYDINSLQMLHASHNVETRINGNKVEFYFDDINLTPLAKGNVVFKIKTKPTLAVNSTVINKAEIFFDYNWPIVTNEAETTFAVLSAGDFAIDNSVSLYPNPAITKVTISASSEIKSVQLYDIQGRLLMATQDVTLDISDRASGMYFVKVMTEKGMKVEKLVKK